MKTVFVDVDTQLDFMLPAGALYVRGAETVLPVIARLNRYAADHSIPLISTADAHAEDDPEFVRWPAHCVAGTLGQQKPQSTLVGQTIIEKQQNDVFTNPRFAALVQELGAERCVVYGVVTEICVKCAALGLLKQGLKVEVVTDAVKSLDDSAAEAMFADLGAGGGTLTTADRICV